MISPLPSDIMTKTLDSYICCKKHGCSFNCTVWWAKNLVSWLVGFEVNVLQVARGYNKTEGKQQKLARDVKTLKVRVKKTSTELEETDTKQTHTVARYGLWRRYRTGWVRTDELQGRGHWAVIFYISEEWQQNRKTLDSWMKMMSVMLFQPDFKEIRIPLPWKCGQPSNLKDKPHFRCIPGWTCFFSQYLGCRPPASQFTRDIPERTTTCPGRQRQSCTSTVFFHHQSSKHHDNSKMKPKTYSPQTNRGHCFQYADIFDL